MGLRVDLVLVDLGLRSEGLGERSLDRATTTARPSDGRGAGVWEGRGEGRPATRSEGRGLRGRRGLNSSLAASQVEVRRRLGSGVGCGRGIGLGFRKIHNIYTRLV